MARVATTLSAFVPVLSPIAGPNQKRWQWMKEVREELEASSLISREVGDIGRTELTIDSAADAQAWTDFDQYWSEKRQNALTTFFLKITTEVYVNPDALEGGERLGTAERKTFAKDFAATNLAKVVGDLITVANIAKPGSIRTDRIHVFADQNSAETREGFRSGILGTAYSAAKKYGWPEIQALNITDAWQWATRIDGLERGVPRRPVGRAFAAVSHLLQDPSPLSILWAVYGLEALLAEGRGGARYQIREKSQTILGRRTDYKKQYRGVYSYRSDLVHGNVNVPLSYSPYNAAEEYESFHEQLDLNERLAAAILVACLQKMIENKAYDLDFSLGVEFKRRPDSEH